MATLLDDTNLVMSSSPFGDRIFYSCFKFPILSAFPSPEKSLLDFNLPKIKKAFRLIHEVVKIGIGTETCLKLYIYFTVGRLVLYEHLEI